MGMDLEKRLQEFQPLLNNLCATFKRKFPFVEWDDLYNQLAMHFIELCLNYDASPKEGYERGVDFPYYAKIMLTYAAWNYVRKELNYRNRVIPNTPGDLSFYPPSEGDSFDAVVTSLDLEQALQRLQKEYPEDYTFLLSYVSDDPRRKRKKHWSERDMERLQGICERLSAMIQGEQHEGSCPEQEAVSEAVPNAH